MLLGDSVMHDASYGITAALESTGEATVDTRTIDGFGLTTATELADVHPQPHPPDAGPAHRGQLELGPVRPDDTQRPAPAGAVHAACSGGGRHHAPARQRRRGGDLHRVPLVGRLPLANPANTASYNKERRAGLQAWNAIAEKMTSSSRAGSCTSRWPAPCFSTASTTRPGSHPRATRTRRTARGPGPQTRQCPPLSRRQCALRRRPTGRHDGRLPSRPRQWELVPGRLDIGSELQQPARGVPGRPSPRLAVSG